MARFIYLNLNPNGVKEEDCVTRAITLISGLPYEKVYDKLWLTAELYECDTLCKFCYSNFITNVLKYKEVNSHNLTVEEFADLHPHGSYLVRVNGHLTAIKNGNVYDIWDCRDEICDIVWKKAD